LKLELYFFLILIFLIDLKSLFQNKKKHLAFILEGFKNNLQLKVSIKEGNAPLFF